MQRAKKLLLVTGGAAVAAAALGVGGAYAVVKQQSVAYAAPIVSASTGVTTRPDELAALRSRRVFFGHQSIGDNLLSGLDGLYRDAGTPAPTVRRIASAAGDTALAGGGILHAYIGENGDPEGKVAAFDSMMRTGLAQRVDVALMKLCYVDFGRRTDPRALFDRYRNTMESLERDFPNVAFVYTTVPLTVGAGRTEQYVNNVRSQFNSLVRTTLKDKNVLDIAEIESRAPDGSRAVGDLLGFPYEALQPAYASDGAHLNDEGSKRLAAGFVAAVNDAAR